MTNYILEATEEQFQIINKALDLFVRIQMGQISELTNPFIIPLPDADYSDVSAKIIELKKSMFPELSSDSYYSIKSKKLPDTVRQAVDIFEVIRHRLAMDNLPENTTDKPVGVQYEKPFNWSNEMPLSTITKVIK